MLKNKIKLTTLLVVTTLSFNAGAGFLDDASQKMVFQSSNMQSQHTTRSHVGSGGRFSEFMDKIPIKRSNYVANTDYQLISYEEKISPNFTTTANPDVLPIAKSKTINTTSFSLAKNTSKDDSSISISDKKSQSTEMEISIRPYVTN